MSRLRSFALFSGCLLLATPAVSAGAEHPGKKAAIGWAAIDPRWVDRYGRSPLAEIIANADAACLVERLNPLPKVQKRVFQRRWQPPKYNVVRVAKSCGNLVRPLDDIELEFSTHYLYDGLSLLVGHRTSATVIKWSEPIAVTEDQYEFASEAPLRDVPDRRLAYFISFLGSSDAVIADNVLLELGLFPLNQVAAAKAQLSKETLNQFRRWLADPQSSQLRLTVSARVLSACGAIQEVELFETALGQHNPHWKGLLKEIATAYLASVGEKGIDKFDQLLIVGPLATAEDAHAAVDALTTIGDELPGKISKARLLRSMHSLLVWPDQAWRAIRVLAQWQDWSVRDRLMTMYDDPSYVALTKGEIVRYLLTALRSGRPGTDGVDPRKWAAKCIEQLRQKDPDTVARMEQTRVGTEP